MKPQIHEEPKILAAAEKQMQAWSRAAEITDRLLSSRGTLAGAKKLGPFLTISREFGAGGSLVAELVGQKLGWEVLDKGILDRVSQRYHLSRPMLELVDETKSNWAHNILGTWLDPQVIPHEKYIIHMRQVVLNAAHSGNVVFVGRGVQFLLPRKFGIAVRVIAPEAYRINQLAKLRGVNEKEAYRLMKEIDRGRAEFVTRYFHRDITDPHLYDLVLNVEHHGPAKAADAIATICGNL